MVGQPESAGINRDVVGDLNGLPSCQETIRESGLWNTNYAGEEYAPGFLDVGYGGTR
jgi:hypothetical protein